MKAFADWWKRCLRSKCCGKFWSWFATSQSKTKSYPLHRSWRQTMRLVLLCGVMADRRAPGAGYKYWTGISPFGLAEISSAWSRSVRRVRLQLVGDRPVVLNGPVFLLSITHAEQLLAPLLLCFTFALGHSRSFARVLQKTQTSSCMKVDMKSVVPSVLLSRLVVFNLVACVQR